MRSYAQNFEDVRLARVLGDMDAGFYIDVGAAHPTSDSVTRHFYELGWHGINIEPNAGLFAELQRERPRDINLEVACSSSNGVASLHETDALDGWATLSTDTARFIEEHHGRAVHAREVRTVTLASVCAEHVASPIDFLKVDAEAHETAVLEGADFTRWRPRIVVVEATWPHSRTASHQEWEPLLLAAGYQFAVFDGVNRFYIAVAGEHGEWAERLAEPISVFDDWELDRYLNQVESLRTRAGEQDAAMQAAVAERDQARRAAEHWETEYRHRVDGSIRMPAGLVGAIRSAAGRGRAAAARRGRR
jgi:FkbM family methyltransferase